MATKKRKTTRRTARPAAAIKQRNHARHAVLAKRKRPAKAKASGGLRTLYPAIKPYKTGMLRVSETHEIYYEECGNPKGKPAVFVHGGPGAGCDNRARSFFDPDAYRIILFDQRGCGRSKPHASLEDNTTWRLVEDMEKLRKHLSIDKWLVFGGSWGSTLGLAYSQTHPEHVSEIVLRGIFTLTQFELRWFYFEGGASALFPDHWQNYVSAIPPAERGDMIKAFYKRLTSDDRETRLKAARAWSIWEAATSYLHINEENLHKWNEEEFAVAVARIECHYFINRGFLETEDQLIRNVEKIRHIPGVIVQGRYDVVCPMQTAWKLHQAWPEADFQVSPDAGHSAFEAGNTHRLIEATDKFR
jgi:proline iminopeptidase